VCVALHTRSLPLGDPSVRALLLQTLLQVGELALSSDGALPRLEWRGDVEECDGWTTLEGELAVLADELREKPGDHAALLLLAQVTVQVLGFGVMTCGFEVWGLGSWGKGFRKLGFGVSG
jgi:hypothetical protein